MIDVKNRLELVNKLRDGSTESKQYLKRMFDCYTIIAEAIDEDGEDKMGIIRANKDTFNLLCDKDMISVIKLLADTQEFKSACMNSKELLDMLASRKIAVNLNMVAGQCSLITDVNRTLVDFNNAIKNFNIEAFEEQTVDEMFDDTDYEENTEGYSADEEALMQIIMGDGGLSEGESGTDDIQFDESVLQGMKLSNKDNSAITEDLNEYEKEDIEDVELEPSELDEIADMIEAIVSRNEAVFRGCLELDRPYGLLYNKGLARCKIEDGKLKYVAGMAKGGKSTFEVLYNKITGRYQDDLVCANDLRNTPTAQNISQYNMTYYPGYVFQYAFGCVNNKTFRSWGTFSKALREEVTKRLKILYKKDLFYDFKDKIEGAFTNAALVIDYDRGGGLKIRLSIAGVNINCAQMERDIKSVTTYANATVNVRNVNGMADVVDIQVIMNEKQFLSKPSWAYKAMEVKINSGDKIDLNSGIPIGRKLDGEIVNFTFKPAEDFVTLICAGSGAGKGVLTLSMLGAALGNNVPVFYVDYKPDMAAVFWELEEELGIHTFAIDGLTSKPRKDVHGRLIERGVGIPHGLKGALKQYSGTIAYIKTLTLMCALAQHRADNGFDNNVFFIFDEIQAAQKVIKAMMSTVYTEMKIRKPKGKEEPGEEFLYLKALADMVKDADIGLTTYLNTTGRVSGIYSIFIGQSPNWDVWSQAAVSPNGDYPRMDLFGQITKAGTVRKLIGKGAGSSKYGLSSLAKSDPVGKRYVEENRFFGMYQGNNCEGVDITVFKPFLTLNSDDIAHKCWTGGIGKQYGYRSKNPDDFERYRRNVAEIHPGDNKYGVNRGTGFLGLTGMYCNQNTEQIKEALEASYKIALGFMRSSGMLSVYKSVEEMLYDVQDKGLLTVNAMLNYTEYLSRLEDNAVDSASYDSEQEVMTDIIFEEDTPRSGDEHTGVDEVPIDFGVKDVRKQVENSELHTFEDDPTFRKEMENAQIYQRAIEGQGGLYDADEIDIIDEDNPDDVLFDDFEAGEENRPVCVNNDNPGFEYTDKHQKDVRINVTNGNTSELTKENSIDCTRCHSGAKNWRDLALIKTPRGQDKMSALLWKDILNTIEGYGYKGAVVTRLSVYGNQMYINGHIVNLNGVIGGVHDIRLQDIFQIGPTLKRFRYIRELRIGLEILDSIQLELGENALEEIFRRENNLLHIDIAQSNGFRRITRSMLEDSREAAKKAEWQEKMAERRERMQFDAECKARNTELRGKKSVGYDLSMNKYAKSSFGNASQHLFKASKPSLVKGIGWGAIGIAAGIVSVGAGILGGGFKAIKGLTEVGK